MFEGPVNAQEIMSRLGTRYGCESGRQPGVLGVRKGEGFRLCKVQRDKAERSKWFLAWLYLGSL